MSLQAALHFIQQARQREDLRVELQRLGSPLSLDDLVRIGIREGLVFTSEELRTAFGHDWGLRWAHRSTAASGPGPATRRDPNTAC